MASNKDYTIGTLAEEAEVTTRTIRYYVAEELLPAPAGSGRAATYSDEHLARLRLIKVLKDEYLPLNEIRSLMAGLDYQAVKELLAEKQRSEVPPPAPESAKAYLQTLLHPPQTPEPSPTFMRHKVKAQQSQGQEIKLQALKKRSSGANDHQDLSEAAPDLAGDETTEAGPASAEQPAALTRWRRITLTPDIELHVKEGLEHGGLWPKINQLIKIARQLLT